MTNAKLVKSKPAAVTKKKAAKKRREISPQERAQAAQKRTIRNIFKAVDFIRIKSDGIEFKFETRTGEIDDIFIYENIIVITEYTVSSSAEHISKKSIFLNLIFSNSEKWITQFSKICNEFSAVVSRQDYSLDQYKIRACYVCSTAHEELEESLKDIRFLDGTKQRYFEALTKTIHKSARYEILKYLNVPFEDAGKAVHNSGGTWKYFDGHLLPENHSSFPPGFKVTSFYADPDTLLAMCYVLRRDSWRTDDGLYQRVLVKGRMAEMRKYLTTEGRVFVNNIIVTLPPTTALNDPTNKQRNLDPQKLKQVTPVTVSIPYKADTIGLIDGQHRVFCYHEGTDKFEPIIKAIRGRQNLLVTGIVFPDNYSEAAKRRFEAKLFLEINDKQKRAKSELKQSIELILYPFSNIAIAKSIIQKLNEKGPLKGMLQTNFFDPVHLIKTTSIVSYGLRPLIKLEGTDSLFSIWNHSQKETLKNYQKNNSNDEAAKSLLDDYINFSVLRINELLIAAKMSQGADKWRVDPYSKKPEITPTVLNGYFSCLRRLIENRPEDINRASYSSKLKGLESFPFSGYKSSHWRKLGDALYRKYFS